MGMLCAAGAVLRCSFGTAPSVMQTAQNGCLAGQRPAGTIRDAGGGSAVLPFGMCTSMANPQVAAATAAALGVLTPQPCAVQPAGLWTASNPRVLIRGAPCLCQDAVLGCALGAGIIQIQQPGQNKVLVR